MQDDFRNQGNADDGSYPDSWEPKVGDVLCGEILEYRENVGKYHTTVATVVDEGTGEELSLWISTAAMVDRFAELQPLIGERIYVRRIPDGVSRSGGSNYRRWVIKVDREAGAAKAPTFAGYVPSDAPRGTEAKDLADAPTPTTPLDEPDDDLPF